MQKEEVQRVHFLLLLPKKCHPERSEGSLICQKDSKTVKGFFAPFGHSE